MRIHHQLPRLVAIANELGPKSWALLSEIVRNSPRLFTLREFAVTNVLFIGACTYNGSIDPNIFIVAVFSTIWPDLDVIPFYLLRHTKWAVGSMRESHRLWGHSPVFLILESALVLLHFNASATTWFVWLTGTVAHSVLDSLEPHGFHWLWPASKVSFSLHGGRFTVVPWFQVKRTLIRKARERTQKQSGEIGSRIAPQPGYEKVIVTALWMCSAGLLATHYIAQWG